MTLDEKIDSVLNALNANLRLLLDLIEEKKRAGGSSADPKDPRQEGQSVH